MSHQLVDPAAGCERRVELQKGFRPKQAVTQFSIYEFAHASIADVDEAADVAAVLIDDVLPEAKHVHGENPFDVGSRYSARRAA